MRKEIKSKTISVIALCVCIIGLSVGFASYSSQLKIKPSLSTFPDRSKFNVDFSTTLGTVKDGDVKGISTGKAIAGTARIDNNKTDSIIKNLSATFFKPGDSVTYKFYSHNAGQFEAFLNRVIFMNAYGANANKVCKPINDDDNITVASACNNIELTVKVGYPGNQLIFNGSVMNVRPKHSLVKGVSEPIELTITYTGKVDSTDDFSVSFGDIILVYEAIK